MCKITARLLLEFTHYSQLYWNIKEKKKTYVNTKENSKTAVLSVSLCAKMLSDEAVACTVLSTGWSAGAGKTGQKRVINNEIQGLRKIRDYTAVF